MWDNATAALGVRPMQRKDTTSFQQSDFWKHQSESFALENAGKYIQLLCLSASFDPPLRWPSPFVTFSQIPSFREKVSGDLKQGQGGGQQEEIGDLELAAEMEEQEVAAGHNSKSSGKADG